MEILKNPSFDFLGKTKIFVTLSILLIAAGLVYMQQGGVRYGVEFAEGTQLIVHFKSTPAIDRIRNTVEKVAPGAVIQVYDEPSKNQILIRVGSVQETNITEQAQTIIDALGKEYAQNHIEGTTTEIVGPTVGAELRQKAILLTVLGLLFQMIYIGLRFKGAIWGAAATIACFHDVLVTLGFLAFFGHEITLNVIAALLTLVGYSVNDTIVIFDRARENLRHHQKDALSKILNDSLNQTLTRTLISNGTTFLAVLGLYLFGGAALAGFGFTMVVGIVVGTYSTIYIASPIVILWDSIQHRKEAKAAYKA